MKKALALVLALLICLLCCTTAFAASGTYTVKAGDTLSQIALNNGVSLKAVIAANPQIKNPSLIYVGQKINIPAAGAPAPAEETPAAETPAVVAPTPASLTAAVGAKVGNRAAQTPGYQMVEVPASAKYDNAVVNAYMQEFVNLTQVPHSSSNNEKMTAYLKAWAEARGVEVFTEEIGNVIMNVPATEGFEDAPLVIFQGHIDMVPAVDAGVEHDWTKDPLKLLWNGTTVKADGTSLGADNGSGVAFALTYIDYQDCFTHGPVRMIFTVDEEIGCFGAQALDAKFLNDAKYMINIDGGYGGAIIACAGGCYFEYSHDCEWEAVPAGAVSYTVSFSGLKGGHSAGVGGGKANGLVALADTLVTLDQAGIEFRIASIEGGNANNAIPSSSKAVIVLAADKVAAADEALNAFGKKFMDSYSAVETKVVFSHAKSDEAPAKVLSADLSVKLVQLMSVVPNNIHTLLAGASGTEASSNLGTISLTDEKVSFICMMRSSSTFQAQQITLISNVLAEMSGFSLNIPSTFATWPLKGVNKLGEIAADLFKEMTGGTYSLSAIHAGVECGEFAEKAPDLLLISTGVSGGGSGHTTAETMNFDKVEVSMDFLITLGQRLIGK